MLNFFICYMAVGVVMAIGLLAEDLPIRIRRMLYPDHAVVVTAVLLAWPLVTWYDYNAKESARHG